MKFFGYSQPAAAQFHDQGHNAVYAALIYTAYVMLISIILARTFT